MTEQDFQREGLEAYFNAHQFPDTDNDPSAIHHTLGNGPREAAPGNHSHTNLVGKWWRNAARNVGNSTWTTVNFDVVEFYSPSVFERLPAPNAGVKIKREGFYQVYMQNEWANNTVGGRGIRATVNSSNKNAKVVPAQNAFTHTMDIQYLLQLGPNDEIYMDLWQDSGGSLAVGVGGANITFMTIVYLGTTPIDFLVNEAWQ